MCHLVLHGVTLVTSVTFVTHVTSVTSVTCSIRKFHQSKYILPVGNLETQTNQIIKTTPTIKSSSSICFSLCPRKIMHAQKALASQLVQMKPLFKCILSTNSQTKIFPICTDSKVLHLWTSDHINELTTIGVANFFKPNKGTNKTLTGDFHISSPLTYEELESHPKIASWLGMNGYNTSSVTHRVPETLTAAVQCARLPEWTIRECNV